MNSERFILKGLLLPLQLESQGSRDEAHLDAPLLHVWQRYRGIPHSLHRYDRRGLARVSSPHAEDGRHSPQIAAWFPFFLRVGFPQGSGVFFFPPVAVSFQWQFPLTSRGQYFEYSELGKPETKPRRWTSQDFVYDNVYYAILTLFTVSTGEGWPT